MKILRWIWIAIIAILVVYLGVEELWYFGYGGYRFACVHEWSTSVRGTNAKAVLFLGIVGFAVVTEAISLIVNRRRNEPNSKESETSASEVGRNGT